MDSKSKTDPKEALRCEALFGDNAWTFFTERHPEIGQQITVRWRPPYEDGETDLEWAGPDSIDWGRECLPLKWRPLTQPNAPGQTDAGTDSRKTQ